MFVYLPLYTFDRQSPGKIKRREVSWTLMKKLNTLAGPGEIKRREVVLDPQVSPEEIKSREMSWARELDFFCFSCFPTAELTVPHSSWDSNSVVR